MGLQHSTVSTQHCTTHSCVYTPLHYTLPMSSIPTSWVVPGLLLSSCVVLGINIVNIRGVNKHLVESIERARSDMRVAMDTSMECQDLQKMKDSDHTERQLNLDRLTREVQNLTDVRNNIQEELERLQEKLDGDKSVQDAENNKINEKLIKDLAESEAKS